ncbi:MAG: sulfatase [Actinomycetota bacterium]|nr:sulfatase [Actinomycetota bacterium]
MIRRAMMAAALVSALLAVAACGSGGNAPKRISVEPPQPTITAATRYVPPVRKPNILVIEADDMRTDELKFMPNVRKLIGARGLTFQNSFAPYPLCCPSRSSFLSGKYAHNHHVLGTSSPFGFQSFDDHQTLATVLQGAGYQTALIGKYLNGYAEQHVFGSHKSSRRYVPPGWTQWMGGSDHLYPVSSPLHGGTYNYWSMTQVINGKVVPHRGRYSTDVTAQQTRTTLTQFGNKKKPWFIWWTPVAPHFGSPHERDDPKPLRGTDGKLETFKTPARPTWVRGRFDKQITHALGQPAHGPAEADMSDKPKFLRIKPEMTSAEKAALTKVSRQRAEAIYVLDKQIAVTIDRLQKSGQYNNTIIAFTSDNGYFLGEHRKRQGKILAHEPSLRVPFLIAGPGIRHGTRYDPITTIDMAPTFAAYAGLPSMPQADGVSMVPVINKGDQGWARPVVTEGYMGDAGYQQFTRPGFHTALNSRGIRTARYKYVKYSTGEVELYDLKTDPLELNSRQRDPAYAAVMRKLDALWTRYYNCKQASCATPMPKEFRATAQQERAITDNEATRTAQYYK